MHLNSFRGVEAVNWFLRVFKDLETRQDAVAIGNQLMDRAMFTHVNSRHQFRDGHYIYQIAEAYRTSAYPTTTGFFGRPLGRSVPSTPAAEAKRSPSAPVSHAELKPSAKSAQTQSASPADVKNKTVNLSAKLRYNVDSGRKSNQAELVNLHYGWFWTFI